MLVRGPTTAFSDKAWISHLTWKSTIILFDSLVKFFVRWESRNDEKSPTKKSVGPYLKEERYVLFENQLFYIRVYFKHVQCPVVHLYYFELSRDGYKLIERIGRGRERGVLG